MSSQQNHTHSKHQHHNQQQHHEVLPSQSHHTEANYKKTSHNSSGTSGVKTLPQDDDPPPDSSSGSSSSKKRRSILFHLNNVFYNLIFIFIIEPNIKKTRNKSHQHHQVHIHVPENHYHHHNHHNHTNNIQKEHHHPSSKKSHKSAIIVKGTSSSRSHEKDSGSSHGSHHHHHHHHSHSHSRHHHHNHRNTVKHDHKKTEEKHYTFDGNNTDDINVGEYNSVLVNVDSSMEEEANNFLSTIPFDGRGVRNVDIKKSHSTSAGSSPLGQLSYSVPLRPSLSKPKQPHSKSKSRAASRSYSGYSQSNSEHEHGSPSSSETALHIKHRPGKGKIKHSSTKHNHDKSGTTKHNKHVHNNSKSQSENSPSMVSESVLTQQMALDFLKKISIDGGDVPEGVNSKSNSVYEDDYDFSNQNTYYVNHGGAFWSDDGSSKGFDGGTMDRSSFVSDSERTDDSRRDPRKSSYVNAQSFCSEDGRIHKGKVAVYCVGEAGFRKKQDKWNRQRPPKSMYFISFYHSQFIACSSYIEDDILGKEVSKDSPFPDILFSFNEAKTLTSRSFSGCMQPTWGASSLNDPDKPIYGPESMIDNPFLKLGYKRSVFAYPSFVCSIHPYIDSKDLKSELNEQFALLHPEVCSGGVTLTKLRRIKAKIIPMCLDTIEESTAALCYCLIDKLLRTGKITKRNLRLSIAICLFLSVKTNEDKSTRGIIALRKEIAKTIGVSSRKILEHEFQ